MYDEYGIPNLYLTHYINTEINKREIIKDVHCWRENRNRGDCGRHFINGTSSFDDLKRIHNIMQYYPNG